MRCSDLKDLSNETAIRGQVDAPVPREMENLLSKLDAEHDFRLFKKKLTSPQDYSLEPSTLKMR